MTFLKIIFFTFYVYNSFKFTKRSIIKVVRSAFVEYKMRIFLYAISQTTCIKFPWVTTGCTNVPPPGQRYRTNAPGLPRSGGEGEMGTGGIDWCIINYLKNNWMAPQTIEIGLWILRRCSYWYVTTIHSTNNSWKATKPFKTICHLNSSYTWLNKC